MSAFKQLTTKDVTITPFDVNKGFSFTGTAITASNVGIEVYYGEKPTSNLFISGSAKPTGFVSIPRIQPGYIVVSSNYITQIIYLQVKVI
jgi:hypothetical protein